MLTREHAIAEFDFQRSRILPDRLTQKSHAAYLGYAERMLRVYRLGVGRTRRELHRAVENVLAGEEDCPARRIAAFAKLLDDAGAFEKDARGRAAKLRREVFHLAAAKHPLVRRVDRLFDHAEADVKAGIARQLGRPWAEIEAELFADVIDYHRLARFDGYADGRALLARYNVAQVQVALYGAVSMTVWATGDFKTILRYAKLAGLLHTIQAGGPGRYAIRLDGPASVLRHTRRYGVAMARFLPAVIACRGWRLHAVIRTRRSGWEAALDLSDRDGLTSHLPGPEAFDSRVEQSFAEKWGDEPRDGWRLERESEILHRGQKVFVPDFTFRHDDGRRVLMEIVGFWTPDYLRAKFETLGTFADVPILLAVAQPAQEALPELPPGAIPYKTALKVKDVLERLAELGER
jgi:predicted nuclease of restriction endonuclease-like RecB superfamily